MWIAAAPCPARFQTGCDHQIGGTPIMIELIATDFDGTIHDLESVPRISHELLNWLRYAQGEGIKWVICTGRQWNDKFAAELRALNNDPFPDYIVTVEREILVRGGEWFEPDTVWNTGCTAHHAEIFEKGRTVIERIWDWLLSRTRAEVFVDQWSPLNIIAYDLDEADKVYRYIQEEFRSFPDLAVVRNRVYFRLSSSRYSKGSALGEIARRLGLAKQSVFAVGDHYNDLTMLDGSYAGLMAAPANAIPEVKSMVAAQGGYVARQPYSLG